MQQTFRGHLAVLIDENTYSDGETFAEGVQRLKLGALIGRRSSGAGVWLSDSNRLLDGGLMRAAENGQFALDGSWLIEGRGVVPDIDVDNPPRATAEGGDAQLDAAVAHLLQTLSASPIPKPVAPARQRPVVPADLATR
jgi:tricorn protease